MLDFSDDQTIEKSAALIWNHFSNSEKEIYKNKVGFEWFCDEIERNVYAAKSLQKNNYLFSPMEEEGKYVIDFSSGDNDKLNEKMIEIWNKVSDTCRKSYIEMANLEESEESEESEGSDKKSEESEESDDEFQIDKYPDRYIDLRTPNSLFQNKLILKIKNIDADGFFVTNGTCYEYRALTNPGIYIGNDLLTFPLTDIPESTLLEDAPFGKGTETVLDHAVRKTLQVQPSNIRFKNPDYHNDISKLAKLASRTLGLSDYDKVEAHLHKLLIYRKGDHFTEHRDAVHREGMFGTLIIQLPSIFTGGDLTVSHAGESVSVLTNDEFQSTWTVFYADCLHKIEPITSGIRTVLTYDLIRRPLLSVPRNIPEGVLKSAKEEVINWMNDKDADDDILFIACEHLYPRSILGNIMENGIAKQNYESLINKLKGKDQARARALYTDGLIIGLVSVSLCFSYDSESNMQENHIVANDIIDEKQSVYHISKTGIFAPNGFKNTPFKYMRDEPYIDHVGNESQMGELELAYSALVLIPVSKINDVYKRIKKPIGESQIYH
jgi:hypothetical protein